MMEMATAYHTTRQYHRRKRVNPCSRHHFRQMDFYWINNLVVALICSMLVSYSSAALTTEVCTFK